MCGCCACRLLLFIFPLSFLFSRACEVEINLERYAVLYILRRVVVLFHSHKLSYSKKKKLVRVSRTQASSLEPMVTSDVYVRAFALLLSPLSIPYNATEKHALT